ncbi:MAG: hypothetical protein QOF77_1634 [Solirubrobacteraceae bacterium]|nr:hypothetical protein [Solirubrobacteraceae bacterium]
MTISSRVRIGGAAASAATGLALITMSAASAQPAALARAAGAGGPTATLVAQLPDGTAALDASPDPTGRVIYFTTNGARGPGIFGVAAAGGAPAPVLVGGPLRGPLGLAVSDDARRLFVADPGAGHITVVAVGGAATHVLRGTAGSAPRGLEVETVGGREYVVYTGRRNGRPAVLRISAAGARRPSVLAAGGLLRRPDGVAIARGGAIYVTDQGAGGRVLRVLGNRVTTVAGGVSLGRPGGVALTLDESKLLVSSLNPIRRTAQVLIIALGSGRTSTFDAVIGANRDPGGLHRARAARTMGWADVARSGKVYRIEP